MVSLRNLLRRKMRSFLTISGIVIGIFALVVMGGMAENINMLVDGSREYLENNIMVSPREVSSNMFGVKVPFSDKYADELREVEGVKVVCSEINIMFDENPEMINMGLPSEINGFNINEFREAQKYMDFKFSFMTGEWWEEGENSITVLGISLANQLGVSKGDIISNRGKDFKVVGILNRTMTAPDDMMFIPLEDARELLIKTHSLLENIEDKNFVTSLLAVAKKDETNIVTERINDELPHLKAISPEETIKQIDEQMSMLNLVIIASALIALIVGGLSVINTMLMSVMERIKEIGLKKAVGAGTWDILKEYILESSLIGIISGLIGLGLGWLLALMVNYSMAKTGSEVFIITPRLAIGSLCFAIFLSVIAGLYPAYKATKIDPVKALKNE